MKHRSNRKNTIHRIREFFLRLLTLAALMLVVLTAISLAGGMRQAYAYGDERKLPKNVRWEGNIAKWDQADYVWKSHLVGEEDYLQYEASLFNVTNGKDELIVSYNLGLKAFSKDFTEDLNKIDFSDAGCQISLRVRTIYTGESPNEPSEYVSADTKTLHKITFDSMGGTAVSKINIFEGNTHAFPTDPGKNNYAFAGWYKTNSDFESPSNMWDFERDTVERNMTVYAKWIEDGKHVHSVNGSNVSFKPWPRTKSLPTDGNYYLLYDVDLKYDANVTGNVKLCLAGHTVTCGSQHIVVRSGGSFDLLGQENGSRITGFNENRYGTKIFGAINVDGGTFTMHSGLLTGNKGYRGAAVYVASGTAKMLGGSITNNRAEEMGGGVAVMGGSFELAGGTISGNSAGFNGSPAAGGAGVGVCGNNAAFIMSGGLITQNGGAVGSAVHVRTGVFYANGGTITGNKGESYAVYINHFYNGFFQISKDGSKTNKIIIKGNNAGNLGGANLIKVNGEIDEDSEIFFAPVDKPKQGQTIVYTSGLKGRGAVSNFACDNDNYIVVDNGNGEAALRNNWLVTFKPGDGSTGNTTLRVPDGETTKLKDKPSDPAKAGYDFGGWYTDDGTFKNQWIFDDNNFTVTENKTLYAKWTMLPATAPSVAGADNLALTYGYTSGSISVTATAATDTNYNALAYQWYSCDDVNRTNPKAISNAKTASYTIPTGKTAGTTEYYYCAVTGTRTDNQQAATATSSVAAVTVGKASLTDVRVEQNGTLTYTGSAQTPDVKTWATAKSSQPVTFTYSKTRNGTYGDMPTVTDATEGSTIYYKASAPNHNDATGSFTVTVNKANVTITAPAAKKLIYSGTEQELVSAGAAAGGTMQYALGSNATTAPTTGWNTSIPVGINAGSYSVWYKAVGDRNHKDTAPACVPVTVGKEEQEAPTVSHTPAASQTASDGTLTITDAGKAWEYSVNGGSWIQVNAGTAKASGLAAGIYRVRYQEQANYLPGKAAEESLGYNLTGTVTWIYSYAASGAGSSAGTVNEDQRSVKAHVTLLNHGISYAETTIGAGNATTSGVIKANGTYKFEDLPVSVDGEATSFSVSAVALNQDFEETENTSYALSYEDEDEAQMNPVLSFLQDCFILKWTVNINSADAVPTAVYVKVLFDTDSVTSYKSYAENEKKYKYYSIISQQVNALRGTPCIARGEGNTYKASGSFPVWIYHPNVKEYSQYKILLTGYTAGGQYYSLEHSELPPVISTGNEVFYNGSSGANGELAITVERLDVPVAVMDANGPAGADAQVIYADADTYANGVYAVTAEQIGKAQIPVWEGHTFLGWYDAREGGNPVSGSITLSRKTTLYAHWKKILQDDWIQGIEDRTYTGGEIKPDVTVKDGDTTLVENKDYTVAFENNTNAGTASVIITAGANSGYTGKATASFTIRKADIVMEVTPRTGLVYTGEAQKPVTVGAVTGGSLKFALGNDDKNSPFDDTYRDFIPDVTDAGTWYVWYKAIGDKNHNSTGDYCQAVTIAPVSIADASVTLSAEVLDYSGSEQTVTVTEVKLGNNILIADKEYEVTGGTTGTKRGIYTVTVTGKGNYKDSATEMWGIGLVIPTIDTVPTASAITYGQKLKDSTLSGGAAKNRDVDVEGTFEWENAATAPAVSDSETTEYDVVFIPTDTEEYFIAKCKVKLVVNKGNTVPATVTANNRTYDGMEKPLVTVDDSMLAGGEMQYALGSATEATQSYTTAIPAKTDAGIYYVWYYAKGDENHQESVPNCVPVTIDQVQITVTAASREWTYDGEAHTSPEVTLTEGELLDGDTLAATASGSVTNVADTKQDNNPVAEGWKILHGETDVTANYAVTPVAGTLTINTAEAAVTEDPMPLAGMIESEEALALVTAGEASGGTMRYALGEDDKTTPEKDWSDKVPAGMKAGTYYVWYKAEGDENHTDSAAACVAAVIAPGPEPEPEPKPEPEPVNKILMFVRYCYNMILGREADEDGENFWFGLLSEGKASNTEVIIGIVSSDEFAGRNLNNRQKIAVIGETMEANPQDLNTWADALEQGSSLAEVINGLGASNEFDDLRSRFDFDSDYASSADLRTDLIQLRAFVARCYEAFLGREADDAGMNAWAEPFASGKMTAAEIIAGFMFSEEFAARELSNEDIVKALYKVMLNRTPDKAGINQWAKALYDGEPIQAVINGISQSDEFIQICQACGIRPGFLPVGTETASEPTNEQTAGQTTEPEDNWDEAKITAFIRRAYKEGLDRDAGEEEVAHWVSQVMSKEISPAKAARMILASQEMEGRALGNEAFVKVMYKVFVNRDADPDGLAWWMAKLEGEEALTRVALMKEFCNSKEYKEYQDTLKK